MSDRLSQLQQMLERTPDDAFLLYGIAMEHKKLGATEDALRFLKRTIEADPNYCYAYYQRGQLFAQIGDRESARRCYHHGIEAAGRAGDAHAREELQAALDLLE
ncbi:MAG: hypothetical protein ACREJC_00820 [Tepidisphaeraceae bacterium]